MDYPLSRAAELDLLAGRFTDGVPGLTPASIIPSQSMCDIIDEILAVQVQGGVTKDEANKTQLKTSIMNMIDARGVPVGATIYIDDTVAPPGFLKRNGALVNISAYPALFAKLGTRYGGNGTTTFGVGEFRAEFIRSLDDGRGVDTGRVLGSTQASDNLSHNHAFAPSGSTFLRTSGSGLTLSGPGAGSAVSEGSLSASGGSESRPRNIALLACIKF